jgi:hypothetical protein
LGLVLHGVNRRPEFKRTFTLLNARLLALSKFYVYFWRFLVGHPGRSLSLKPLERKPDT